MYTADEPHGGASEHSALSQIRTREELGEALTGLRVSAGLSVREVVRTTESLSLGTASGWFSGQHVPTRASEATFVRMLELLGAGPSVPEWKLAVERVRSRPGPRRTSGRRAPTAGDAAPGSEPAYPDYTDSPYVGLRPYRLSDASLFHGRSGEIDLIIRRVSEPRDRPLVVVGASGSGKSSLLAAGVGPRWSAEGRPVTIVHPAAVTQELTGEPGYLVVDQLEELWARDWDATRRGDVLARLAERAAGGLPTMMALRADFFQPALAEPVLRGAMDDPVVIGPPGRDELTEIIVEPARALGYWVEPSLVPLLLDAVAPDTAGEAGERSLLPLLSHVLLVCWERSRRRRITVADYYTSGGIEGALRTSAESVYQQLDKAQRSTCRSLFLRLVDVRSERIVRRHAPRAELTDDLVVVATTFATSGLLTVDGDTVTPTHEILFSSWPRLVDWIDADREGLRVLARIRAGAADWEARGRGEAALPTASATAEYVGFVDDDTVARAHLGESETRFIEAARTHHDTLTRRDRRRLRELTLLAASLAVVTILALVSTVFALRASGDASETRDIALSRSGSVSSTTALTRDPALGRALALAAYRIHPTDQARSALLNTSRAAVPLRYPAAPGSGRVIGLPASDGFASVSSDGLLRVFSGDGAGPAASLELASDRRTELYAVTADPDGTVLAVAGQSGVHLVDVRTPGQPALLDTLGSGAEPFHSVAFSPDGTTLAAGTGDGRVLRWALTSGDGGDGDGSDGVPTVSDREARVSTPDRGGDDTKSVQSLAWLPDSRTLLATNHTGDVKTLLGAHADGPGRPGPALDTGDLAIPLSLAVNADGTRIAAGTTGRAVYRWRLDPGDLDSAEALPALGDWNAYVSDVAFDDAGRLAASGTDERLRVYSPGGELLTELPASQVATGVDFTRGGRLVSYSVDGLVRLWPLDRLGAASESNSIFQTASSRDRTVGVLGVTASERHYTIVNTTGPVPRETGRVIPGDDVSFSGSVAMSPGGDTVYAGLADGGIQVFTAPFGPSGEPAATLPVTSGVVVTNPVSPDGQTLAVCSGTSPEIALVNVSDPENPTPRVTLPLPDPCVVAEFSADSGQLVVPTVGPETLIINTSDPDRPTIAHRLATGIGASPSAGYAHSQPLLATSGGDQTIRLWDVTEPSAPRELSSLPAPPGEIYWTAFSADDDLLVLTSSTGQVTVVDVSDPESPRSWATLGATTDPLLYQGRIASPDGGLLAVGVEGAIWMWQLDPDRVIREACAGGIGLTDEEWARHFPETETFDLCD